MKTRAREIFQYNFSLSNGLVNTRSSNQISKRKIQYREFTSQKNKQSNKTKTKMESYKFVPSSKDLWFFIHSILSTNQWNSNIEWNSAIIPTSKLQNFCHFLELIQSNQRKNFPYILTNCHYSESEIVLKIAVSWNVSTTFSSYRQFSYSAEKCPPTLINDRS